MPTGPNEFSWIKFGKDGNYLAQGGDAIWTEDITEYILLD